MNKKSKIIFGIVVAVLVILIFVFGYLYYSSYDGESSVNIYKYDVIENIYITANTANILIDEDENCVVQSDFPKRTSITNSNGELNISERNKFIFSKKNIDIAYKKDTVIDNVDIETNTGNIYVSRLNSNYAKFDTDSGSVGIENLDSVSTFIETDTGNVKIYDSKLNNVDIETDDGSIVIKNTELLNNNYLSTDIGNIDIELTSDDYKFYVECGFCSINYNGEAIEIKKGNFGEGNNLINIKTDTGNINITTK